MLQDCSGTSCESCPHQLVCGTWTNSVSSEETVKDPLHRSITWKVTNKLTDRRPIRDCGVCRASSTTLSVFELLRVICVYCFEGQRPYFLFLVSRSKPWSEGVVVAGKEFAIASKYTAMLYLPCSSFHRPMFLHSLFTRVYNIERCVLRHREHPQD